MNWEIKHLWVETLNTKFWELFNMPSSSFSFIAAPVFSGENYQVWAIKTKAYLQAMALWDAVENEADPPAFR